MNIVELFRNGTLREALLSGKIGKEDTEENIHEEKAQIRTPAELNVQGIIPPENGWEKDKYYIVEVAHSPHNVIHRAIYYSKDVHVRKGGIVEPIGEVYHPSYDGIIYVRRVYYMKIISPPIDVNLENLFKKPAKKSILSHCNNIYLAELFDDPDELKYEVGFLKTEYAPSSVIARFNDMDLAYSLYQREREHWTNHFMNN